jgi:hypothetical protein
MNINTEHGHEHGAVQQSMSDSCFLPATFHLFGQLSEYRKSSVASLIVIVWCVYCPAFQYYFLSPILLSGKKSNIGTIGSALCLPVSLYKRTSDLSLPCVILYCWCPLCWLCVIRLVYFALFLCNWNAVLFVDSFYKDNCQPLTVC